MSRTGSQPARLSFRTVAAALGGATAAEPLPPHLGAHGYYFSTPRGRIAALWTEQGKVTVRLPAKGDSVQITGMSGQTTSGNPAAIPVGTSPVLVRIE